MSISLKWSFRHKIVEKGQSPFRQSNTNKKNVSTE